VVVEVRVSVTVRVASLAKLLGWSRAWSVCGELLQLKRSTEVERQLGFMLVAICEYTLIPSYLVVKWRHGARVLLCALRASSGSWVDVGDLLVRASTLQTSVGDAIDFLAVPVTAHIDRTKTTEVGKCARDGSGDNRARCDVLHVGRWSLSKRERVWIRVGCKRKR